LTENDKTPVHSDNNRFDILWILIRDNG